MGGDNKIWRWYKRHGKAVEAVLDIACDMVPGGRVVLSAIKLVLAKVGDEVDSEKDRQMEEVERLLNEIKPVVGDIVDEVEHLDSFGKARNLEEARRSIQKSDLRRELQEAMPQLVRSISLSSSRMQSRRILQGKYELLELIGRGGQGEIYRAVHLLANHRVAVKLLPAELSGDETSIAKLRREFRNVVTQLAHPHIVQYRDLDRDEESGRYFLVMDCVEGRNLRHAILDRQGEPMPLEEALKLLEPVASALDFAHSGKIVHCDLKPENIMVRAIDGRVYLTDFGLAREIHSSLSRQGMSQLETSGTLPYMAPEQYLGRPPDAATDIWALGVILYELVAGRHPFPGTSFEHFMKLICEVQPQKPEALSQAQWAVMGRMLHKDSKARSKEAGQVLRQLGREREKNDSPEIVPSNPCASASRNEGPFDLTFVYIVLGVLGYIVSCVVFLRLIS